MAIAIISTSCFNTQPPEGGWKLTRKRVTIMSSFNTQPPEGGWSIKSNRHAADLLVSTHSRPKAAGNARPEVYKFDKVSTHSRPKAAGICNFVCDYFLFQFQHTAARRRLGSQLTSRTGILMFQHTAARRRLAHRYKPPHTVTAFQHTAARRRLDVKNGLPFNPYKVSTHSRPKAAGTQRPDLKPGGSVSTHSRPKAAGLCFSGVIIMYPVSTHSRPKAAGQHFASF